MSFAPVLSPQQVNFDILASCLKDDIAIKNLEAGVRSAKAKKADAEKTHADTVKKHGGKSREAIDSRKPLDKATHELKQAEQVLSSKKSAYQKKCANIEKQANQEKSKIEKPQEKKTSQENPAPLQKPPGESKNRKKTDSFMKLTPEAWEAWKKMTLPHALKILNPRAHEKLLMLERQEALRHQEQGQKSKESPKPSSTGK